MPDVTPWSIWRHKSTNSLYVVLGVGVCTTNGEREGKERSVLYFSITHRELCYCEVGEFTDGRFEHVAPRVGG